MADSEGELPPGSDPVTERTPFVSGRDVPHLKAVRERFTTGMTAWLHSRQYRVGMAEVDPAQEKQVEVAKKVVSLVKSLVTTHGPMFISGGADTERIFDGLVPFLPISDFFGFRNEWGRSLLLLVIFADDWTTGDLLQRLDQIPELGRALTEIGLKLNGSGMGAHVYPLFVFFEEEEYEGMVPDLMRKGWQKAFWSKVYVHAGFVNVPAGTVTWTPQGGIAGAATSFWKGVGVKVEPFNEKDLAAVMAVGEAEAHRPHAG